MFSSRLKMNLLFNSFVSKGWIPRQSRSWDKSPFPLQKMEVVHNCSFFLLFLSFFVCFFVGETTAEFLYHSLSWATIGPSQSWPLTTWGRRYNGVTAHFWFVIIPLQNSTCVSSTHECTVDLSLMINLSFPPKAATVAASSRPIFIYILFAVWTFRSF